MSTKQEPILCFVKDPWAYFTTQPLDKQWGDDWDDAPYEHNAGGPYKPHSLDSEQWDIVTVAFEGPFRTPCYDHYNSPFSVRSINQGAIPWLVTYEWVSPFVAIPAGTTLSEFKHLVSHAGGTVYERTT